MILKDVMLRQVRVCCVTISLIMWRVTRGVGLQKAGRIWLVTFGRSLVICLQCWCCQTLVFRVVACDITVPTDHDLNGQFTLKSCCEDSATVSTGGAQ